MVNNANIINMENADITPIFGFLYIKNDITNIIIKNAYPIGRSMSWFCPIKLNQPKIPKIVWAIQDFTLEDAKPG